MENERDEVPRSAAYEAAYKMARDFDAPHVEKLASMRDQINWLATALEKYKLAEGGTRSALDSALGFIHGLADGCAERA